MASIFHTMSTLSPVCVREREVESGLGPGLGPPLLWMNEVFLLTGILSSNEG